MNRSPSGVTPSVAGDVRPLEATVDEVASLMRSVVLATYPPGIDAAAAAKTADITRVERLLRRRSWFGARDSTDGSLVSVAAVHMADDTSTYLSSHFVTRRRAGIGTRLTAARLNWVRRRGATRAAATTQPWNAASLANLRRHGFVASASNPTAGSATARSSSLPPASPQAPRTRPPSGTRPA